MQVFRGYSNSVGDIGGELSGAGTEVHAIFSTPIEAENREEETQQVDLCAV